VANQGGFGGGSFGGGPWGSFLDGLTFPLSPSETVTVSEDLNVESSYKVSEALSLLTYVVRVTFNAPLDQGWAPNFDADSYSIPGLDVIDVAPFPNDTASVLLLTSEQLNVPYLVTAATGIRNVYGDFLDASFAVAPFSGSPVPPTFRAVAQSRTKIRLTFLAQMSVDSEFVDPANYTVSPLSGTPLTTVSVSAVEDGSSRKAELIVAEDLVPGAYYAVTVNSAVQTIDSQSLDPESSLFQWQEHVPAPISIAFQSFSGEVSGGLLGDPDGQVFFSPAYDTPIGDSNLQVDSVSVCTRAYDVYQIPDIPDPPVLFTHTAPDTPLASSLIGAGTVLWAPAPRLGLAQVIVHDLREDTLPTAVDGPADATLTETVDITRASFLNDIRWETAPAATASLGVFITADNQTPIGPGPTTNINLQPAPP
jgi:hypothetical protein